MVRIIDIMMFCGYIYGTPEVTQLRKESKPEEGPIMTKNQILSEIKKIMLKHKGKRNAISAGKIADMLNLKQEHTHVEPRKYIYDAMKKIRHPDCRWG